MLMSPTVGSIAIVAWLASGQVAPPFDLPSAGGKEEVRGSYIFKYEPDAHGQLVPRAYSYIPQPGDLVFYDDHSKMWGVGYKFVGSGPPFHSGLVVALPDGTPVVLESGPDDTMWVRILALPSRFQGFEGDVWIRQVKQPLTPEQNARLTDWALHQDHKHYALWRLLLQATPFRCRNDLQQKLFGATRIDRNRWLCSELVVAGGTVAGLFDANVHFANAIYPRDIIFDNKYDLSAKWHEARYFSSSTTRLPPGMVPR
jgi:hypothetical protein